VTTSNIKFLVTSSASHRCRCPSPRTYTPLHTLASPTCDAPILLAIAAVHHQLSGCAITRPTLPACVSPSIIPYHPRSPISQHCILFFLPVLLLPPLDTSATALLDTSVTSPVSGDAILSGQLGDCAPWRQLPPAIISKIASRCQVSCLRRANLTLQLLFKYAVVKRCYQPRSITGTAQLT
jgi:hypothetical protein